MKKLKFITALFFVFAVSFTAVGQDKTTKQAKARVEKLNQKIIAQDATLALSTEQISQLVEINLEKANAAKKIKNEVSGEEAQKTKMKALNKEILPKIKAVLTKEQLAASRSANSKKGKNK